MDLERLCFTYDVGTPQPARYVWVAPCFENQIEGRSFVWDSEKETWAEELPDWVLCCQCAAGSGYKVCLYLYSLRSYTLISNKSEWDMQAWERISYRASLRVVIGFLLWLMLTGMAQATPPNSEEWNRCGDRLWAAVYWGPTTTSLTWYPYIPGDYDRNGEVGISDITVLGLHFGKIAESGWFRIGTVEDIIDRDHNGEINIADLSIIGLRFGVNCTGGFNVYRNDEMPELLGHVDLSDSHRTESGWTGCSYDLGTTTGKSFSIRPVDGDGVEGAQALEISRHIPHKGMAVAHPTYYDNSTGNLQWDYVNRGDYNQDGLVWVDCYADHPAEQGELGMTDKFIDPGSFLNPIADGLHSMIQGYYVYSSDTAPGEDPTKGNLLGSVPFTDAQGDREVETLYFKFDVGTPPPDRYLWVAPYFEDQIGDRSTVRDTQVAL